MSGFRSPCCRAGIPGRAEDAPEFLPIQLPAAEIGAVAAGYQHVFALASGGSRGGEKSLAAAGNIGVTAAAAHADLSQPPAYLQSVKRPSRSAAEVWQEWQAQHKSSKRLQQIIAAAGEDIWALLNNIELDPKYVPWAGAER